jgi:hypothetical protein
MGADLIVAMLATDKPEELDFAAGRAFILNIDLDDVRESEFVDNLEEGEDTPDEELREELERVIHNLEEAFEGGFRDQTFIRFGAWELYLAGGTSYGDSPGPTFDAINDAGQVPGLLESIGFGWPDHNMGMPPLVIVRGGIAHEHVGTVTTVDMDDVIDDVAYAGPKALKALLPYGDATQVLRDEIVEEASKQGVTLDFCKHCGLGIFWDAHDQVWRHDEHEGVTCGSLSPNTYAEPLA